jgi:hypothetical protein
MGTDGGVNGYATATLINAPSNLQKEQKQTFGF